MKPYKLDPILNKEKIFQISLPPTISNNLLTLPDDWLIQLEKLCRESNSALIPHCFTKHITTNNPTMNQTLIEHLQIIYHCLKGNLDASGSWLSKAEHMVIISKLTEDIDFCTEGFRNRVNDILHSLVSPRTLSELLCQSRMALVKNIAYELTQNIHTWNKVIDRAVLHGLGIKNNTEKDPYPGNLTDEEIDHTLREKIEEKYTPFNLVFLLTSQLDGILLRMGYTGPQQDGYSTGTAEKIGDRINCYLTETEKNDWKKIFIIDEDDDFNIVIRDLNWQFIRKCFLQTLIQKGYFSQTPSGESIGNLLDCAFFSALFCENNKLSGFEERYITHQLFNREAYLQLENIKMNFPIFWQKLSTQHLILFLISELEKKSFNEGNDIHEKIKLLFSLDLKSLMNDSQDSVTLRLLELIKRNTDDQNLLMWAARNQSNSVSYLIELMKQYPSQFDNKMLEKMYSKKDSFGSNSLMLAAYNQPKAIKPLLESIARLDEEARRQLLLQKNTQGANSLMLAARYQPEAIKPLLESIARLDEETRRQLLLEKSTKGSNSLMLAAGYQPEAIKPLLESIARLDEEARRQLLLQKDTDGWNSLMLAAYNQPKAIKPLLESIAQLDEEARRQLLLQKDTNGWNSLMLAARFQPEAVKPLLESIALLDEKAGRQMLLQKDTEGLNSLMLAARFQPEAVKPLLESIALLDEKAGRQMLLQKDTEGLNSLMLAAGYQPEAVKPLLESFAQFDKQVRWQFWREGNTNDWYSLWNLLMLAVVGRQPETTKILLKSIAHFDQKLILKILLEDSDGGIRRRTLHKVAGDQPEAIESLIKLITQLDEKARRQLFLEKDFRKGSNLLMLTVCNQLQAIKPLLESIAQLDEKARRQIFLQKDTDGWNSLMLAVHNQPKAVKPLLESIARLDKETRRQIFLQKGWNSLMLAACYQPEAIKHLLESITQLDDRTILQIFLEGNSVSNSVILMLASSEQPKPEAIKSIREFIDHQFIAQPMFKQDTLTQMFLQKDTGWKPLLAVLLLNKYLADLARRKEQHITHLTRFFGCNFGYSTDEKEVAARELKTTLEKSGTIDHLLSLKKLYPALNNGILGQLFKTFCKLEAENNLLPAEISQRTRSLR